MKGISDIVIMKMDASLEEVWRVLLDVESYPSTFIECESVENLTPRKSISPIEPGARYAETWIVKNGQWHSNKKLNFVSCCTIVEDNTTGRNNKKNGTKKVYSVATEMFHCTGTSTHILVPEEGEDACQLAISFGMIPNGLYGKLFLKVFGERLKRTWRSGMWSFMEEIRQAAKRNHGVHNPSSSCCGEDTIRTPSVGSYRVGITAMEQ